MRVIAGSAKGMRLGSPPKGPGIRPVQDRVKESIFSILHDVSGLNVLDVFAGSGALGIEALSRGAAFTAFVESSKAVAGIIRGNLAKCGFEERGRILNCDFKAAAKKLSIETMKFDLAFVDPPYFKGLISKTLILFDKFEFLKAGSLIVAEHHKDEGFEPPPGYRLTDQREYGQTFVSFLGKSI